MCAHRHPHTYKSTCIHTITLVHTHTHSTQYWPFANSHLGQGEKNTSWTRGKSALFSNDFVIGGLYPLSSNLLCVEMVLETEKKSALFSSNFLRGELYPLSSNFLSGGTVLEKGQESVLFSSDFFDRVIVPARVLL